MKRNFGVRSGGFALGLLAIGLAICLFDLYTSHHYGFHLNEVAGIAEDGSPIDWPTGERPMFTMIPLFVYALGFWLAAAAVQACRLGCRCDYDGRIYRGTE